MNADHPRPDIDEARAALAAADRAPSVTTGQDIRTLRGVLVGVGAAMAMILPMVRLTAGNRTGFVVGMGLYAVIMIALLVWQRRTVRAVPRGYGKWYSGGIGATSAMYAVGILVVDGSSPWWLIGLMSLLVLAPAVVCASRIGGKATR